MRIIGRNVKKLDLKNIKGQEVGYIEGYKQTHGIDFGVFDAEDTIYPAGTQPSATLNTVLGAIVVASIPNTADTLFGITQKGEWYDNTVSYTLLERTGFAQDYTDDGNVVFANLNGATVTRAIKAKEVAISLGLRRALRDAKNGISVKPELVTTALQAISNSLNQTAFYGDLTGDVKAYGLFNEPTIPAPVAFYGWSESSIYDDILPYVTALIMKLATATGADVFTLPVTLAIPSLYARTMVQVNTMGKTIRATLMETFTGLRIVTASELNSYNGSKMVYAFIDAIDGVPTIEQIVQSKGALKGQSTDLKGDAELYIGASAGIIVNRPDAIASLIVVQGA